MPKLLNVKSDLNAHKWIRNAHIVESVYGGCVDWKERFYECPECGEPIYKYDWSEEDLEELCPICGFTGEE